MTTELQKQLFEKYPTLFRDKDKSPKETCMCWGIEFDNGWYKIFDDLCAYLMVLSKHEIFLRLKDEFKTEENKGYIYVRKPSITFTQVKEKYGTMRVYWIGNGVENYDELKEKLENIEDLEENTKRYYDQVENAIEFTEFLSSKTCEVCSEPGKVYTNGWYMSRCKKCIVEHYGFDPDDDLDEKEF